MLRTIDNSYPLFKLRLYHSSDVWEVIIFCFGEGCAMFTHTNSSREISKSQIWTRSGGKCECTVACEHHEAGRCCNALLPEFWSTRDIFPAWVGAPKSVSMLEAVCEACRMNAIVPRVREQSSARRWDPLKTNFNKAEKDCVTGKRS